MNEEERAKIVARAIDALLDGANTEATDDEGVDGNLQSLLDVAQERLLGSMFLAKASLQHEREVWRTVVKRIQDAELEAVADDSDTADQGVDELAEVIAMRRSMATEAAALGEAHKEEVWATIQRRISQRSRQTTLSDIWRPFRRRSDTESSETESRSIFVDEPLLIPPAHPAYAMGPMAASTHDLARARVWARVATSPGLDDSRAEVKPRRQRLSALSALGIAAAVAVVAFAVGPLPATGFADHPAVRAASTLGEYLGAENALPPALTQLPPPTLVEGRDATPAEASAIAGVTFGQPLNVPDGFQLTTSTYFPQSIAGKGSGALRQVYSAADANLVIYQEAGSGVDFAVGREAATPVALSDGTPATLVQGSWLADEGLSWSDSGAQSLLFERAGVRVVIELGSASPRPKLLFQVADSIRQ